MRCPHGEEIAAGSIFGVSLYSHGDGRECDLLNRLNVGLEELHLANLERAAREPVPDEHILRLAHAAYKTSAAARLSYLERLSGRDAAGFAAGFAPVRLAMAGDDEAAAAGLYLLELYFAFAGITSRVNSVNESLSGTAIYRFLGEAGADRIMKREDEATRAHAGMLDACFPHYKNKLTVPGYS